MTPGDPQRALIPVPREPSRAQWITFGILLTISIALVAAVFSTVWKPIFLGAVLAGALSGWHERVALRFRQKRGLSSVLFTIGVVFLFLIPLSIIVGIAVSETISAIHFVQETLEVGGARELVSKLPATIQEYVRTALDFLSARANVLSTELASNSAFAVAVVRNAVSTTGGLVFDGIMMLIALKFLLSDGFRLIAWVQNASPLRGLHTAELLHEFHRTSKSALGSMTITAATQGVIAAIGYAIAGVPQPFFFGLLTFFTSFIPAVGTGLVAIPLAVLLLLLGKTVSGIFLIAYAFLVIGMVDNLLKPLLMKGGMRLHGALVFFALIGGVWLFGPVGLIAGPLTVTFFVSMVRLGQRDFAGIRASPPRP